jgi:hypothetical protein
MKNFAAWLFLWIALRTGTGDLTWQRSCLILSGEIFQMATPTALNPGEEAQLQQTIEMFEVIVQSQPNDCQSLEILKEAYTKLGREEDVVITSKRIAQAYMQTGAAFLGDSGIRNGAAAPARRRGRAGGAQAD